MKRVSIILVALLSVTIAFAGKKPNAPKQPTREELHKLELAAKDSIVGQKDLVIDSLQKQIAVANAKIAVYEFFNDEEISIFNYKKLGEYGNEEKLIGKNRIKYETIRMIADVESRLSDIEDNKIPQLQKQQNAKKWSAVELRNAIRLDIKADMDAIGEQLDAIDKRDLTFLSDKQLAYYRKQSQRFDAIYNKYL